MSRDTKRTDEQSSDQPDGEKVMPGPHQNGNESDPANPTELGHITGSSWKYALKRAWTEFNRDQCTDVAAGLTYYSVQSLFPALLALIALLGIFGQDPSTVSKMLASVKSISPDAVNAIDGPLAEMTKSKASGWALVVGLLTALWSASGYIGAFGRALNRIYDVREGRPLLKLRPLQLLLTLITVTLTAVAGIMLALSGPVAEAVGNVVGLGDTAVTIWNIVKWPIIAAIVIAIIALLYYATPNVKMPKFKWLSPGAAIAFGVWVLGSVLLGLYVANFGNYNKTYGTLAGVIVFLLWLWLTNLALLFGAEFDVEVLRARQLQAGMKAEKEVILEPRDEKGIKKQKEKQEDLRLQGMDLRREAVQKAKEEKTDEATDSAAGDSSSDAPSTIDAPVMDGADNTGAHKG